MNRRSFLAGILAAGVAPAFVGSSILMPVRCILRAPDYVYRWVSTDMITFYKAAGYEVVRNGMLIANEQISTVFPNSWEVGPAQLFRILK